MLANNLINQNITTAALTTFTFNNLPFQPGIGNATAGSDMPYYPGCKVTQGVVIVVVFKQPTETKLAQVTIYDGATMLVSPTNPEGQALAESSVGWCRCTSPSSGKYDITYNSKYIRNPSFFWGVGDGQSGYDNMAYLNGNPLTTGSNFWNSNTPFASGNLISVPQVLPNQSPIAYQGPASLNVGNRHIYSCLNRHKWRLYYFIPVRHCRW